MIQLRNIMKENGGMSKLSAKKLDPEIVQVLKRRAARHGHSSEAEHRDILEKILLVPKKKSFPHVSASIPHVGEDTDFERVDDYGGDDIFN